jgi:signal transduction histidine kinase
MRASRKCPSQKHTHLLCSRLLFCAALLAISDFGLSAAIEQPAPSTGATIDLPALTNIQSVLDLGPFQARRLRQPVHFRGTVMSFTGRSGFIHDGNACILVYATNSTAEVLPGKLVEVEAVSESGIQAPIIARARLTVLGDGQSPVPRLIPVARLVAGEGCWQYVRVEGVVRDMNRDASNLALSVAAQGRRFIAILYQFGKVRPAGLPLEWLEARVALDGICWTDMNDRNQPVSFHLAIFNTNQVKMVAQGPSDLFSLPLLGSDEGARLRQPTDTRLKIAATVVSQFPDGRIFLQSALGPIQARLDPFISLGVPGTEIVEHEPATPVESGDGIQLVGAPVASDFAPILQDAVYRPQGRAAPPAPVVVKVAELSSGQHDAELVQFEARLLAQERRPVENWFVESLVFNDGDNVFEASWRAAATNALPYYPLNSRLRVEGICVVQPGPAGVRHAFQILLRGPADVAYLGQTPFWAQPVVGRVLWIGIALLVGAGLWVWMLRRRVQERTSALATANLSLKREAEERERAQSDLKRALAVERELGELKSRFVSLVSHEFRTPLGITMSAVELLRNYLDRLPPHKLKELLDDIYSSTLRMSGLMEQVLLLGRVEAGKLALRAAPVDLGVLAGKLADEALSATVRKCPIQVKLGSNLDGAEADEGLLRHILSNLLSNAVKYSRDGRPVELNVARENQEAVFQVRDHGIGIPFADQPRIFEAFHRASNAGQTQGTGLGLLIVKRCVELHEGRISFETREGEGTTFTVRLPLFEAA